VTSIPTGTGSTGGRGRETNERVDGLQAWLAALDHRVGVRTYAGAAAAVLSLTIAIVALVLALQTPSDAVTQRQLDAVDASSSAAERQAANTASEEIAGLKSRIRDLEREVSRNADDIDATDRQVDAVKSDINELRREISSLSSGG